MMESTDVVSFQAIRVVTYLALYLDGNDSVGVVPGEGTNQPAETSRELR